MLKPIKNIKVKGLYVYCNKCKTNLTTKCGLTGKRLSSCALKERHKYKAIIYIPGADNKVRTRLLETRDEAIAINEVIAFRKQLEQNNYSTVTSIAVRKVPQTIVEGMAYYISYLNNETPHEQEHKQRTKAYINEVERTFRYFLDYLNEIGVVPTSFKIENVNKELVGKLKSFLLDTKDYAPKTYNKYIGLMRIFLNFMIEEFNFQMKNPFKGFKRLKSETKINTITKDEFEKLLEKIGPDNNLVVNRTNRKNMYRPWLKDAILLALLTGRRREEIVKMKFSGIIYNSDNDPVTLGIEDFKVNRSNDVYAKESVKMIYVPIISPLKKLLQRLGSEENRGKDMYILAPEETMERKTMMDFMSKAFTHYYAQLNTDKKLTFYDLRKTYISHLYASHGKDARIITGHSGDEVMLNHYIDGRVVAEVAKDFELFGL